MLTNTHTFTAYVPSHRQQVWDWFARPGAFLRLAAPWGALQPAVEAKSLRDGEAVLQAKVATAKVPGARWVAKHQPQEYIDGHQFADVCVSQPFAALTQWRHLHRFEDDGDGAKVIDRVTSRVPRGQLAPMFEYRSRQLIDDLAAHARAAQEWSATPSVIAITGASGLVGSALSAFLSTGGHTVVQLVRGEPDANSPYEQRRWNPDAPVHAMLDGVDVVVHLAGAPIGSRFTADHMAAVRDSRVGPTRRLAEAIAAHGGPKAFVSASAIGYYGSEHGDELLDESSPSGDDFLASVVREWEASTAPAADATVRTVRVRTGIVQSARGGTLALMRPLYESFLGGRLGDGKQWMSWIGLDDLVEIYHRAIFDADLVGPVNAVAPQAVRNSEYSKQLAATVHRPNLVPVPGFGPRLLLGNRGARELALASQRVVPAVLVDHGHHFRYEELPAALAHELGSDPRSAKADASG
ncbi:TIGR01777 family protein [Yimella sp. cx-573]|nr:TIGR01777 family protein [Yimella sp. cx-573]